MPALSSSLLDARSISSALLSLTLVFSVSACAKRWHDRSLRIQTKANDQQPATSPQTAAVSQTPNPRRININTASANELETLPGIGRGLAARIIEHREKYGPFRRPEHLIIVRGISDRRFRALRDFVTVE
jgi:competence protein ComEA